MMASQCPDPVIYFSTQSSKICPDDKIGKEKQTQDKYSYRKKVRRTVAPNKKMIIFTLLMFVRKQDGRGSKRRELAPANSPISSPAPTRRAIMKCQIFNVNKTKAGRYILKQKDINMTRQLQSLGFYRL